MSPYYGKLPDRLSRVGMTLLAAVTLFSIVGYGVFGVHPELLAKIPSAPAFYGIAFVWSARIQVILSAVTLILFLISRTGTGWLWTFLAVYAISLSSEWIGTTFGLPFGEYSYTGLLGWKWFDHVPYLIPVSWFTMTIPAAVLARAKFGEASGVWRRMALGATLLTTWDLALDPAMSHLTQYWRWADAGPYFGMPLINLFGWWLTAFLLMAGVERLNRKDWLSQIPVEWSRRYYLLILSLPVGMSLVGGAWPAALVTVMVAGALLIWIRNSRGSEAHERRHAESGRIDSIDRQDGARGNLRADEAGQGWAYFRAHSRSFSFSSRFLGRRYRLDVSRLYALCRVTDDIVDGKLDEKASVSRSEMLGIWRATVLASFRRAASGYEWLDGITQQLKRSGLKEIVIEDFFSGIHSDLDRVRVMNMDDLLKYSYGVASTVGIMMCHLFGVRDEWRLARAVALGQAMQITNILRDVGEDLARERIYLPASLLDRHGLSESDLRVWADWNDDERFEQYRAVIRILSAEAERLYERAWEAIPHLPLRFGITVAVAASVYRAIHRALAGREEVNLWRRVYTSTPKKLRLAAAGMGTYFFRRVTRSRHLEEAKRKHSEGRALLHRSIAETSTAN